MMAVCQALGLARSNVYALRSRSPSWVDRRIDRTPHGDDQLLADLREQITELPRYGYRRACALVNRQRASSGAPRVNPKRVYRVMAANALLLPKAPRRPQSSRAHTGTVSVQAIDMRWCSPQSNGMAESIVNTFKRDYVSRMDLSDARTVLARLPAAFEHFNEVHPHSSLKMRSPCEFGRRRVEQLRRTQLEQPALHFA